jgi:very-short-patch-repair endonuclease
VERELAELGETFEAQYKVDALFVDFYLPERNLVIECDGTYWHGSPEALVRDHRRDWFLRRRGYRILRLKEDAIDADAHAAVRDGLKRFAKRT